jgi:hypothetical protein
MRKTLIFALLSCATLSATPAAAVELIVNGGFETGTYAGWTPFTWAGSSGALGVNGNGANGPISGSAVNGNPGGGNWVSLTDQTGPGAYSLIQHFTIPLNAVQVIVSFDHVATDWSGVGPIFGPGLDPFAGAANQLATVDILKGGSPAFTMAAGDIVANLYLGVDAGTPAVWAPYAFNLTGILLPGQTYYFRAAEVDNQLFFNQGLDNVSVEVTVAGVVPEPAIWGMMIAGFAGVGLALRRGKRTTVSFA